MNRRLPLALLLVVVTAPAFAYADGALRLENVSDSQKGWVEVGDVDAFELQTLTVECWFTPQGNGFGAVMNPGGAHIVSTFVDGTTGGVNGLSWAVRWSPATQRVNAAVVSDPDGLGGGDALGAALPSQSTVALGETAHVAMVVSEGIGRLYVNGVLEAEVVHPTPIFYGPGNLKFGAGNSGQGIHRRFDGTIDEVRIWSTARTQQELVANAGCRLSGAEPGLLGLWHLDGDLIDSGPVGADGVLVHDGAFVPEPTPLAVCIGAFTDEGQALAGSLGAPALDGFGELVGGTPVLLVLTNALPHSEATLVAGLSAVNAPFKGGVLVPAPDFLIGPVPTSPTGSASLQTIWPVGFPPMTLLWFQFWIQDASGPAGLSSSNAIRGETP